MKLYEILQDSFSRPYDQELEDRWHQIFDRYISLYYPDFFKAAKEAYKSMPIGENDYLVHGLISGIVGTCLEFMVNGYPDDLESLWHGEEI